MKNDLEFYSNNVARIRIFLYRISNNSKRFPRKTKGGNKMLKTLVVGFMIFTLFGLLAGIWGVLDKIRLMLEREMWKKGVQLDNITRALTQNNSPYTTIKFTDNLTNPILRKEKDND